MKFKKNVDKKNDDKKDDDKKDDDKKKDEKKKIFGTIEDLDGTKYESYEI